MSSFHALIRTHHITSRKKVTKLRQAANAHNVFALLRYGGAPGIMYVEGDEKGVTSWVDDVHNLRYKDYRLVSRPALIEREHSMGQDMQQEGLYEIDTVKDFGQAMRDRGVYAWWRRGMGYAGNDET